MAVAPRRARLAGAVSCAAAAPHLVRTAGGPTAAVAAVAVAAAAASHRVRPTARVAPATTAPRQARPDGGPAAAPRRARSSGVHVTAISAVVADPRRARPAGGRVSKAQGQGLKAPREETSDKQVHARHRRYQKAKPPLNHRQKSWSKQSKLVQQWYVQQWSKQPKLVQQWSIQATIVQQRLRRSVRCDEDYRSHAGEHFLCSQALVGEKLSSCSPSFAP